jgi:hypothetical protein
MGICPYCNRNMDREYDWFRGRGPRSCGRVECEKEADAEEIAANRQRINDAALKGSPDEK